MIYARVRRGYDAQQQRQPRRRRHCDSKQKEEVNSVNRKIYVAIRVIVWLINDALLGAGAGYILKRYESGIAGNIIGFVVVAAVLAQRYFMIKDMESAHGKED